MEILNSVQIPGADEALAAIARRVANDSFAAVAAGKMSRGEFKARVLAGEFPELMAAAVEAATARESAATRSREQAAGVLENLVLPAGWVATLSGGTITLSGPYDAQMPARLRRLDGHWDPVAKSWTLPVTAAKSLSRVFGNAAKATAAKRQERIASEQRIDAERAAVRAREQAARTQRIAAEKTEQRQAVSNRVRVPAGAYAVGDRIGDRTITGFGKIWEERVTDDSACAYGLEPGLDSYPNVKLQYAYFSEV